jgi:hypothetical protein
MRCSHNRELTLFCSSGKTLSTLRCKIFTPDNYAPIVLSGIVQSNAESVTTKLEVGFLFHLPYKRTDGDSASLMVATGPNVSANTIIGLLFIKASGMILDLVNKVVECRCLDCPPFPVDFQPTLNHIHSIMDDQSGTPAHHAVSSSEWLPSETVLCPILWGINLSHIYAREVR